MQTITLKADLSFYTTPRLSLKLLKDAGFPIPPLLEKAIYALPEKEREDLIIHLETIQEVPDP